VTALFARYKSPPQPRAELYLRMRKDCVGVGKLEGECGHQIRASNGAADTRRYSEIGALRSIIHIAQPPNRNESAG
jgi:hypothetical protein